MEATTGAGGGGTIAAAFAAREDLRGVASGAAEGVVAGTAGAGAALVTGATTGLLGTAAALATGLTGTLSDLNSLVGGSSGDRVGVTGVTGLTNGNYIVRSAFWGGGASATAATSKGAITWGSGTSGISGVVSSSNSLVGANAGDDVGSGAVTALNNGNAVITSPVWGSGNGTTANAKGAVTWMNGATGLTGTLSDLNSLVGGSLGDRVGVTGITGLTNGSYVVRSAYWGGGTSATVATSKGAITWGSGTSGVSGVLSSGNSLVGAAAGDDVGSGTILALSGGNAVVLSPAWGSGNGVTTNAKGAATWVNGFVGVSGANDGKSRDGAKCCELFDRLVRRTVFTESNRVVRPHEDRRCLHESGESNRRTHVVTEDEERATV